MLLTLFFYIFVGVFCLQLCYWLFLFGKFAFLQPTHIENQDRPISVIIAAKNEAENLKKFLPKILNQNYSKFEVIVIDDASADKTQEVLDHFKSNFNNLKSIGLEATTSYQGNKKNAITQGIAIAQYEYLLFTDADCFPNSEQWISEMTKNFDENKEVVLGYGAYLQLPTFINKLIRYETLLSALQYFSHALIGLPYMGVGRNLAYKKSLFKATEGFKSHEAIASGDDDLLIRDIANAENTAICVSDRSIALSQPKESYIKWLRQKRRHITTANHYKIIHKFTLGLFYISQFLFWTSAIVLLTFSLNWQFVLAFIIIRFTIQYIIVSRAATKLNERGLIVLAPLLDLFLVMCQLLLFIVNLFDKPKRW